MMRKMKIDFWGSLALLLFVLSSCEKKEPLWQLVPLGEGIIDSVSQGETYDNTVFFRFEDGLKTERNINTWSLAFESAANGWHIRLNNGRNAGISATDSTNFSATYTTSTTTEWQNDRSSGHPDSTAVGQWLNPQTLASNNQVFILNIGNDLPAAERYRKVQFLSISDTSYSFKYANLDGTDERQVNLTKSTGTTYTYFDFISATTVDYAPVPADYDIVFTKYRTILMNGTEPMPYNVNGVILNPVNTTAAKLDATTRTFDSLNLQTLGSVVFSESADIIGHDWKFYDLNGTSTYQITPNLFIVKDSKGAVWKLTFIGFYNAAGVKGYPQFRYQRISQ